MPVPLAMVSLRTRTSSTYVRRSGFCPPVGDRLKPRDLDRHGSDIGRYGVKIVSDDAFGSGIDRAVLHTDVKHKRQRTLGRNFIAAAELNRLLMNALRVIGLNGLELRQCGRAPAAGLPMAPRPDGA